MPRIEIPEIKMPRIKIPEIKMPRIEIPEIKIPRIEIPEIKMPKIPDFDFSEMDLQTDGFEYNIPVQRNGEVPNVYQSSVSSQFIENSGPGGVKGVVSYMINDNGKIIQKTIKFGDKDNNEGSGDKKSKKKAKKAKKAKQRAENKAKQAAEDYNFKPPDFERRFSVPDPDVPVFSTKDIKNHVPENNEKFQAISSSTSSKISDVNGRRTGYGASEVYINNNGKIEHQKVEFDPTGGQ